MRHILSINTPRWIFYRIKADMLCTYTGRILRDMERLIDIVGKAHRNPIIRILTLSPGLPTIYCILSLILFTVVVPQQPAFARFY